LTLIKVGRARRLRQAALAHGADQADLGEPAFIAAAQSGR
jgi:hypothetical protein